MKNKKQIITLSIGVLVLLCLTLGISYAYFTFGVDILGNSAIVRATKLELIIADDGEITLDNAVPGDTLVKEFSVKNNGTAPLTYDIYMSNVYNNFVDTSDLVYQIISEDGGYNTSEDIECPLYSTNIISNYSIEAGVTHHYKLKIKFLNKNEIQNDNMEKTFTTKLQMNQYEDAGNDINIIAYYLDGVESSSAPSKSSNYVYFFITF